MALILSSKPLNSYRSYPINIILLILKNILKKLILNQPQNEKATIFTITTLLTTGFICL